MDTYKFIINNAPYDIINYIHEFENPETTFIITKIQEIRKKFDIAKYDNHVNIQRTSTGKVLWTREEQNISTMKEINIEKNTIKKIITILKILPFLYGKPPSKRKNYIFTEEEKHYVESYLNNTSLSYHYVSRGAMILSFIIFGFEYTFKNKYAKEVEAIFSYNSKNFVDIRNGGGH